MATTRAFNVKKIERKALNTHKFITCYSNSKTLRSHNLQQEILFYMKKALLVIDPLSSSKYLINRFNNEGYELIALKTFDNDSDYLDYSHLPFKVIQSSKNIADDINRISQLGFDIKAGIYGNENSVIYADKLLSVLFPDASNGSHSSHLRFNKYYMNLTAKENNLPYINELHLQDNLQIDQKISQAVAFFNECKGKIVIKPTNGSAGSVGVYSPKNINDIRNYFQSDLKHFLLGADFPSYILQEKLVGEEYSIDIASYQKKHCVTSVAKYSKKDIAGCFQYQYFDNIHLNTDEAIRLKDIATKMLNLLGMDNGLSHLEFMKCADGNFRLIELNPRISGGHGALNAVAKDQSNVDQIDALVSLIENQPLQSVNRRIYQRVYFLANNKGIYQKVDEDVLTSLPTVVKLDILKASNTIEEQNISVANTVGLAYLYSENKEALEQDSLYISNLEKLGGYLV